MNTKSLCSLLDVDVRCRSRRGSSVVRALAVLAIALSVGTAFAQPPQPLRNQHLVDMAKAGIDEDTIVKLIDGGRTEFDTSAAALIALKNAGVSDQVIAAVVSAGQPKANLSLNGLYEQPDEVGVYVNIGERLVPLKTEIVTLRAGGVLKKALLSRGHVNAVVTQPMSSVRLDSLLEFIIYSAEGVAAEEYQLLRLWTKRDRREFRLLTGGVAHASSGAELNAVGVDVTTVGARLYRIKPTLPLPKGEYGFLPPGAMLSASAASRGKIYTFSMAEAKR